MLLFHNLSIVTDSVRIINNAQGVVPPGSFVGIVGPNGSGKTTLLKTLAGLLPPEEGSCFLNGKDLRDCSSNFLHKIRSYLPAERRCYWNLRGADILDIMGVNWQASEVLFRQTDTLDLVDRSYHSYSTGEKSRFLLTCTLALDRPLIFLDEPLFSLDPSHQIRIMGLLKEHTSMGKTLVAVFHELGLAHDFCDAIWLMSKGEIARSGTPQEVLQPEALHQTFGLHSHELLYFLPSVRKTTFAQTLKVGEIKNK